MAKQPQDAELTASNADLESVKTELDQANAKIAELTASNADLRMQAKKWGITTLEEAKDHVSKNYLPGDKVQRIMVTQDGNVFYDGDITGSGVSHAQQKEILSFTFAKK